MGESSKGAVKSGERENALPTLDEAEWASETWGTVQGKEEAEESLHKFKELRREAMADLKPHQVEMACQFWTLTIMGITMPEEEAGDEEWGAWNPWYWNWNQWWPGEGERWEPRGSQWNWREDESNEEGDGGGANQQADEVWEHGEAEDDEQ